MAKLYRKSAIVAKIETTSGVDAVPTAAANAILVSDFQWNPMEMTTEERALFRAYLGNSEQIPVMKWGTVDFSVEFAGAGTPGTIPKYGALLRGCGFSETVNAGVSVVYAPVSGGFESVSIYGNLDQLLHKSLFSMGSVAFSLDATKISKFKYSFKGLFVPVTDTTNWSPNYTGYVKPIAPNKVNSQLSVHGIQAVVNKLQFDMKNQVELRSLYNFEGVQIGDRKPDGSLSLEMTSVATKDWMTAIANAVSGPLALVHGTQPGNIMQLDVPNMQIHSPKYSNSQGILMLDGSMTLNPGTAGNDELVLTVR